MASSASKDERVATAVRLPRHLHDELVAQADARDVSVNFLIVRAVQRFLDQLPSPDELHASLRAS